MENQTKPGNTPASNRSRRSRRRTRQPKKNQNLRVIPLGGMEEIGKNLTLLECGDDIVVVDCGLAFPTEEMPGIDLVIPDMSYLEKNKKRVKAVLLTHGHEDHIGALPYLIKTVNVPIYGTKLTLMLAEHKLTEDGVKNYKIEEIKPRDIVTIGCFSVEFFRTNHSIADSVGMAVGTPVGKVVITGDFKVDYTPVSGEVMDFSLLARLGEEGVLLLMAESTNVERPGYTLSERTVGVNLDEFFRTAKGRIIISTFSSNVHRVQQIIDCASRYNRKVCFVGRSMIKIARMAQDIGVMKMKEGMQIPLEKVNTLADKKVVVITTGSQGEPMSGLVRIAGGEHAHLEIKQGDTVIFSSRPIPGNEKFVNRIINQLFRSGANVIYDAQADVHTSGHACREELKLIHTLVKPKYFIPMHGEYRHLRQHAMLAESLGMKASNIVIPQNGSVVEFDGQSVKVVDTVPAEGVLVDGYGLGDKDNIVLRDRKHLAQDGLVVIVLPVSVSNGLFGSPEVISRGFIYDKDPEEMTNEAKKALRDILEKMTNMESAAIKTEVSNKMRKFFYSKTHRNPMVLPIIMEI